MNITGKEAIATGNIVFMNVTVDQAAFYVSAFLGLGYFMVHVIDFIKKWRREDAAQKRQIPEGD